MSLVESFSASYPEARDKFLAAAHAAGADLEAFPHPEKGPDGGDLATDTAWIGPRDAARVLVMLSATHGVEGFCGSGAQVEWLRRGEATRLPAGQAALLVHAINPYGFAWLRRVTHENVDLNRNWIDFAAPPPANAAYDQLAEAIVPPTWTETSRAASDAVLTGYAAAHGFAALQQALSGGQYAHADGIFYGGRAPSWSRLTQTAIFRRNLASARKVAIIDFHTGLGPWGLGEQIITERRGAAAHARARAWYGGAVTCPADGDSTSADIKGDGLSAAPDLAPHAEVTGMALEFGTLPVMQVLTALRADAWLHAHGDLASDAGRAIKAQVRAAFYGDTDDWKGMIVGQSLLAVRQATAGLAASSDPA